MTSPKQIINSWMTVGELIAKLQSVKDHDMPVMLYEGSEFVPVTEDSTSINTYHLSDAEEFGNDDDVEIDDDEYIDVFIIKAELL